TVKTYYSLNTVKKIKYLLICEIKRRTMLNPYSSQLRIVMDGVIRKYGDNMVNQKSGFSYKDFIFITKKLWNKLNKKCLYQFQLNVINLFMFFSGCRPSSADSIPWRHVKYLIGAQYEK